MEKVFGGREKDGWRLSPRVRGSRRRKGGLWGEGWRETKEREGGSLHREGEGKGERVGGREFTQGVYTWRGKGVHSLTTIC